MKKPLNVESVSNELREGSVFFAKGGRGQSATATEERPGAEPAVTGALSEVSLGDALAEDIERTSLVRPSVRPPVRRTLRRHPFEFYQDQLEALKQFSLTDQLNGEKGSMSEMVRDAVDEYISRRRHAQAERTDDRTDGELVRRTRPVGRGESTALLTER
jgi:hypothetical protein